MRDPYPDELASSSRLATNGLETKTGSYGFLRTMAIEAQIDERRQSRRCAQ